MLVLVHFNETVTRFVCVGYTNVRTIQRAFKSQQWKSCVILCYRPKLGYRYLCLITKVYILHLYCAVWERFNNRRPVPVTILNSHKHRIFKKTILNSPK